MLEQAPIITFDQVGFARGERAILSGMDLTIPQGKVVAVMGPSGTGKTTLLHIMGGLLKPQTGEVTVLNATLSKLSHTGLLRLRRDMGVLFQSGALFTHLSVFENVAFPLREHTNLPEAMIRDIVLMKLEAVGLRGARALMPNELSGGMARRVALARAIALDPKIMLYDEPFTGQDPISMGVLVKLIRTLNDALQLTSVIVSHDVAEVMSIADYVYVIYGGKVIGQGTPQQIRDNTDLQVHQFIHGEPDGPVAFHYPNQPVEADFLGGQSCSR